MDLDRKIEFAINLLKSIPTDDGPIEVCYSGGKDSDVILELAKMATSLRLRCPIYRFQRFTMCMNCSSS